MLVMKAYGFIEIRYRIRGKVKKKGGVVGNIVRRRWEPGCERPLNKH